MTTRGEEIKQTIQRFIAPGKTTISGPTRVSGSTPGEEKSLYSGSRFIYHVVTIAALGAVYFVAAKLGLQLAFVYPSASSVWPGTGIALSAILLLGYRVWPGIFLGAFLANVMTAGSVATSLGIALGNTLEGLIGAHFLHCFANGRNAFDRARDILKFAFLAATLSTVISATIGVTSLSLGGYIQSKDFGRVWFTWWLGDTIGSILLTPLLVLWSINPRIRWNLSQICERILFLSLFILLNLVIFGGVTPLSQENYPLEFLCVPFFIWTAFRFDQRETAAAVVILGALALWGTLHGYGPFVTRTSQESLLLLQLFMGVKAVMSLVLAALVAEYRRVETQLSHQAITDPLTGLWNYRKFIDVLDGEIKRAERTERPFAMLFLDVDNLKMINDRLGHIAGNQALCRVANALRGSCRSIDTVARFGGDEFAMILPEAEEKAAHIVADRIANRLVHDHDGPRITVSVGIAVYPTDGDRKESLVSAADRILYKVKSRRHADTNTTVD
jgi:diguanylate cyclase (GGDEF)-like protein